MKTVFDFFFFKKKLKLALLLEEFLQQIVLVSEMKSIEQCCPLQEKKKTLFWDVGTIKY